MICRIYFIIVLVCISFFAIGQQIKVGPYLQDAHPNSIFILWETDSVTQSIVEWGLTAALGNSTTGSAQNSVGDAQIHEVKLDNLSRFTKYHYRVITGAATSAINTFKTPPFASDHQSFRMVAMSDMQRDGAFPGKFDEIVHEGVLDYFADEYGGEIIDNLALVLIPGDLVVTGNNYTGWEHEFFTPSHDLFNKVPVYPVLGNHENNTIHYFQYFKLPDNGTPGFAEHSWYKTYGNVGIIGLDSNNPFNNQDQLNWLDETLSYMCETDSIDFVFAQLHHPHKSELWTPGESNYTGEVISRLEQFTTSCGKPSIHFFGHTHGYSRGQSRDHKHLWINVATAGGAIDNWGEFPNFDYDEFSVSQDEYGFVIVEVTDDADPKLVVKRISRGDQDTILNNPMTDSLIVRLNPSTVNTPVGLFPIGQELFPDCITLKANNFSSTNSAALHGQSHWQVSTDSVDFANPSASAWKNFENWYFEENTQAGDFLMDEQITGLSANSSYWWRVRYRDRELNWSDWSSPVSFTTGAATALTNLLINSGAEDSLSNWTVVEGVVESLGAGVCNGITQHSGNLYFAVGGLCDHSAVGRCIQDLDVSSFSDSIDAGNYTVNFGGYLSDFSGSDLPEMRLIFFDQDSIQIDVSNILSTLNSSWTLLSESMSIPPQTRIMRVELKGTRNVGTDNDSYFDDLFVSVGANPCVYDGPCVNHLPIDSSPILAGSYGANLTITSAGLIDLPTAVIFRANESISLSNEFKVELGATFLAEIGPCP